MTLEGIHGSLEASSASQGLRGLLLDIVDIVEVQQTDGRSSGTTGCCEIRITTQQLTFEKQIK